MGSFYQRLADESGESNPWGFERSALQHLQIFVGYVVRTFYIDLHDNYHESYVLRTLPPCVDTYAAGLSGKSKTILTLDTAHPDTKRPIPVLCPALSLAMNDVLLPGRYCFMAGPI